MLHNRTTKRNNRSFQNYRLRNSKRDFIAFYERWVVGDLGNIIKSLGYEYSWASPFVLEKMFCDDLDFKGLAYWYKELQRISKQKTS